MSSPPRVCPTTGCGQMRPPPPARALYLPLPPPQRFLEPLQAVEGQRTVLAGLQEPLHVGQEDVAGREEARAQPEKFPAPLFAVPVRGGPEGVTGTCASWSYTFCPGTGRHASTTARPKQSYSMWPCARARPYSHQSTAAQHSVWVS